MRIQKIALCLLISSSATWWAGCMPQQLPKGASGQKSASSGATAASGPAAAGPDLIITSILMNPALPAAGQAVRFSANVKNRGNVATPAGTAILVYFLVDSTQVAASTTFTSSLAPNAMATLDADADATMGNAGAHSVVGGVNPTNLINEAPANTTNNSYTMAFNVGAAGAVKIGSLAAFQQSLYPLLRGQVNGQAAQCFQCHGAGSSLPMFATNDPSGSHDVLVGGNYVNFADAGASLIVQKVSGGHMCWGNCANNAQLIMQDIQLWGTMK